MLLELKDSSGFTFFGTRRFETYYIRMSCRNLGDPRLRSFYMLSHGCYGPLEAPQKGLAKLVYYNILLYVMI